MKNKYIIGLVFLLINHQFLLAQNNADNTITTATSANGNYLFLYEKTGSVVDSATFANTDYFVIERKKINANTGSKDNYNKLGTARVLQSNNELKNFFNNQYIEDFKSVLKLKSNTDLVNFFKKNSYPKSIGFLYLLLETKMALGHVYVDKDVQAGEVYEYQVVRVTKNKTQEKWGQCIISSKAPNILLPLLKPALINTTANDSLVTFKWGMPIAPKYIDSLLELAPKPNIASNGSLVESPRKMLVNFYRAKVYVQTSTGFEVMQKLLGSASAKYDSIIYYFSYNCLPTDMVTAYIVLEDEVYNTGVASEPAVAYAMKQSTLPIITGAKATAIENGIRLNWKQLPNKPFIVGIQITKYNSEDKLDSVAILPALDTSYIDYNLEVGQYYRYQIKALYTPLLKLKQEQAAVAVGTFTVFSKPTAPTGLVAIAEGKHIRLNWAESRNQTMPYYYIYRGTSARNIELVAGPINDSTYLDTATALSGRSKYYYAIKSQNLTQQKSEFSNIVSVEPKRKIEAAGPSNINVFYANGSLTISWDDVRIMDNAIESYVVLRKKSTDKKFTSITSKPINTNSQIDGPIVGGIDYEYKVAGIDFKGDTTNFSNTTSFTLPKKPVESINVFNVRNVESYIEILLPNAVFEDRKLYNIYRREASQENFTKIGSISADKFTYEDKTAKPNLYYVYALSITNTDGREGLLGRSISIKKD